MLYRVANRVVGFNLLRSSSKLKLSSDLWMIHTYTYQTWHFSPSDIYQCASKNTIKVLLTMKIQQWDQNVHFLFGCDQKKNKNKKFDTLDSLIECLFAYPLENKRGDDSNDFSIIIPSATLYVSHVSVLAVHSSRAGRVSELSSQSSTRSPS